MDVAFYFVLQARNTRTLLKTVDTRTLSLALPSFWGGACRDAVRRRRACRAGGVRVLAGSEA